MAHQSNFPLSIPYKEGNSVRWAHISEFVLFCEPSLIDGLLATTWLRWPWVSKFRLSQLTQQSIFLAYVFSISLTLPYHRAKKFKNTPIHGNPFYLSNPVCAGLYGDDFIFLAARLWFLTPLANTVINFDSMSLKPFDFHTVSYGKSMYTSPIDCHQFPLGIQVLAV